MIYGFICEILDIVTESDTYWIQYQYALRIDKATCYSIDNDCFFDSCGKRVKPPCELVFWLLDCEYADIVDNISKRYGLNTVDDLRTREQIRNWYKNGFADRNIFECNREGLRRYAEKSDCFFAKSKVKGWSAIVKNGVLDGLSGIDENEFVVSEYREIKEDSIGKIEVRVVVIDGKIMNLSRCVHSLLHRIDDCIIYGVEKIKRKIDQVNAFPRSYVMDVGLFDDSKGNEIVDVVEFNSLSTSLCYVNNSFFSVAVPEIISVYNETKWGYEFCYD